MTSGSDSKRQGFSTRAIHAGYNPHDEFGALNPPLFLNSTYAFRTIEEGQQRFQGEAEGYVYSRVGNPTQSVLEARLADLEGGEAALALASGMGAIAALFWSFLRPGDEIIADKTLYGCTFSYLTEGLRKFGVRVSFADLTDPQNLANALSDATRFVFFETPVNPNMRVIDIAAMARTVAGHPARIIVDNTYATPYLQQPLALGADFVVHSLTKYLCGHGDVIAGAVIGPREDMDLIRGFGLKDMTGAVISPMDAYLIIRGLKTLEIRMQRHCATAAMLAELINGHPAVASAYYPGLAAHPQHDLAARQMRDFGGMIAFELKGGYEAGLRFMDAVKLALRAVSLGDAETLVQHPASMTHATYPPEERARHAISEGLVRISVGLETPEDLAADISQALDAAG